MILIVLNLKKNNNNKIGWEWDGVLIKNEKQKVLLVLVYL